MNNAAGHSHPAPRRIRMLPEAPGALIVALALAGWATQWVTGWVHQLGWILFAPALLLLAAPTINRTRLDGTSWWNRASNRLRAIPRAIRILLISVGSFTPALCAFLWAIGARVDVADVLRNNIGVGYAAILLGVPIGVMWLAGAAARKAQADHGAPERGDQSK